MLHAIKLLFLGFFLMLKNNALLGQTTNKEHYFDYPLAIQPRLNANFGEMRPNHFHMGLDLNTQSRENLPVYAPADGYVSRIKIEQGGFGRAIYLNHPNGTTTVYAHMNRFLDPAEIYLKKKQYEQETWKIDLTVPVGFIKVKKGQWIGFSGNTGASEGPHVHFEIRDTKTENCLNPLRHGIAINDHVSPDLFQLAFYDFEKSIYEQTPVMMTLIKKGSLFVTVKKVELPFEKVMIGIVAKDRMDGSANPNGIFKASLFQEEKEIAGFKLENISYDFTRDQNAHIDYNLRAGGGPYVQFIHPPKNTRMSIYPSSFNQPYLTNGKEFRSFTIQVSDAHNNLSTVDLEIRKAGNALQPRFVGQQFSPGVPGSLKEGDLQIEFPSNTFYDACHLQVKVLGESGADEISPRYEVYPSTIPIGGFFSVKIKARDFSKNMDTSRVVIKKAYKSKIEIKKATFSNDRFIASFRELGTFQLLRDAEAPQITVHSSSGTMPLNARDQLIVSVTDNLKTIRSFEVRLDDKWIMFVPKGNQYVYKMDEHFQPGEHLLTIVVYDEAGNRSVKNITLKRI